MAYSYNGLSERGVRNGVVIHATTWVNIENMMFSERKNPDTKDRTV